MKGRKVLITSGPTWVAVDRVRVLSNIATGETGILLARACRDAGAKVTLLLGPVAGECVPDGVRVVRFRYFGELRQALRKELSGGAYDFIAHSAAVSDFAPRRAAAGKLDSKKRVDLALFPLPKLIDMIVAMQPSAAVVMFKFEPGVPDRVLLKDAMQARERSGAHFVVANRLEPYKAFILGACGVRAEVGSKQALVKALTKLAGAV